MGATQSQVKVTALLSPHILLIVLCSSHGRTTPFFSAACRTSPPTVQPNLLLRPFQFPPRCGESNAASTLPLKTSPLLLVLLNSTGYKKNKKKKSWITGKGTFQLLGWKKGLKMGTDQVFWRIFTFGEYCLVVTPFPRPLFFFRNFLFLM